VRSLADILARIVAAPWRIAEAWHPATKILLWLLFALYSQGLRLSALLSVTGALILWLLVADRIRFTKAVRRVRFVFLGLVSVYAFSTPGEGLFPPWGVFSPTIEGLQAGGAQALRLLCLLSSLSLLLRYCATADLLSGIHSLLRPFQSLGVPADRIAVRTWLTLRYAQQGGRVSWRDLRESLEKAVPVDCAPEIILLPRTLLKWQDSAALLVVAGAGYLLR
jgi:energy-coupling factor transporter transmembrane protein EcfT